MSSDHNISPKTEKIPIHSATPAVIAQAAACLRAGKLVVFPTETVYGLGGDATNAKAIAAIYRAKNRPLNNPLILHVAAADQVSEWALVPVVAQKLMRAFWPGPLTIVLPRRQRSGLADAPDSVPASVAFRVPSGTIAQGLLRAAGIPVAAPSANPSGFLSPTLAEHGQHLPAGDVAMIVDGGDCPVGVESTVVAVDRDEKVRVLRPGGIALEALSACLGWEPECVGAAGSPGQSLESPGQLLVHYAPRHPVRLNATDVMKDEALLSFGQHQLTGAFAERSLSRTGKLEEAAHNLFALLHELDRLPIRAIAVMPIPGHGLGRAINDRLTRAAAAGPQPKS